MPTGPNGEKRPQGDTACAVHVMKIATGQVDEQRAPRPPRAKEHPPPYGDMPRASSREPYFHGLDDE